MKHKILKCHWGTWRTLRHLVPGMKHETMDVYLNRVAKEVGK